MLSTFIMDSDIDNKRSAITTCIHDTMWHVRYGYTGADQVFEFDRCTPGVAPSDY